MDFSWWWPPNSGRGMTKSYIRYKYYDGYNRPKRLVGVSSGQSKRANARNPRLLLEEAKGRLIVEQYNRERDRTRIHDDLKPKRDDFRMIRRRQRRRVSWRLWCRFLDSVAPFVLLPFLEPQECGRLVLTCKRCHGSLAIQAKRRMTRVGPWVAKWMLHTLAHQTITELKQKHDRVLNSTRNVRNGSRVSRNRIAVRTAGAAVALLLRRNPQKVHHKPINHPVSTTMRKRVMLHQPRR